MSKIIVMFEDEDKELNLCMILSMNNIGMKIQ